MKQKIINIIIAITLFSGGFVMRNEIEKFTTQTETNLTETIVSTDELLGITSNIDLYYPLTVVVTEVDWQTNIATAQDRHGNEFFFESDDAWVGDLYSCIVSDNANGLVTTRFAGELSEYECQTETVDSVYSLYGRYYTNRTFIDTNGEVWNYQTESVSGHEVYDGMPICVGITSEGTETLSDDVIHWAMLDYVTELQDRCK